MKQFTVNQVTRPILWRILLGFVAVASFAIFTAIVGGEAVSGKIEQGHYFISASSGLKEVSAAVYRVSAAMCLLASLGFFLVALGVLRLLQVQGFLDDRKALKPIMLAFFSL